MRPQALRERQLRPSESGWQEMNPLRFQWIFFEHDENQGKGVAMRTGMGHVDTNLTVAYDADLEYHPF